jgi:hypothetical protein
MRKLASHFVLLGVFILFPYGLNSARADEYSWQNSYTEDFLNYAVQDDWLLEQVSLSQFKKRISASNKDEQTKERLKWFEGQYQEGDVVWRFMNPPEMWKDLQGVSGYVLVRGGRQVATYITNTSNIEMFLID